MHIIYNTHVSHIPKQLMRQNIIQYENCKITGKLERALLPLGMPNNVSSQWAVSGEGVSVTEKLLKHHKQISGLARVALQHASELYQFRRTLLIFVQ